MSARYLSKVTAVDRACSPLKPNQDNPKPSEKKAKPFRMTEDSPKRTSVPFQHQGSAGLQSEANAISSSIALPSMSKMLYQKRQKNELKRLLKYTHPELKTLEGVVDEELAEVMNSESGTTAAETGYEGEVMSRRWIFENYAPRSSTNPPTLLAVVPVGQAEATKTSIRFKLSHESQENENRATVTTDSGRGMDIHQEEPNYCEEETVRIDVLSARRMFESQATDCHHVNLHDASHGKVVVTDDERGAVQKHKEKIETRSKHPDKNKSSECFKNRELTTSFKKRNPGVLIGGLSPEPKVGSNQPSQEGVLLVKSFERELATISKSEIYGESSYISSTPLFQNNPFISASITEEQTQNKTLSHIELIDNKVNEEMLMANVKNRAQLFESMPFDRINHHNKDEMQTMVEDMNESLANLNRLKAINSHGSIIEVNETGIAKKAKYILAQAGPELQHEEVAQGGLQNFILQLLPRASLQPQVAYLKENQCGNVAVTMVAVPFHQHVLAVNQDKEFRTANAAQLIEDILNHDNSLRKGVIIQENTQGIAEVTVYSLYRYSEGDVEKYVPPQQIIVQDGIQGCDSIMGACDKRNGDVRSTINSLLASTQDYSSPVSIRSQDNIKGNVKLFRSFIEKGDLDKLKTFNADPSEEKLTTVQNVTNGETVKPAEQKDPEWAPVDVKKLKSMFSSNVTTQSCVQPKSIKDAKVHSASLATLGQRETCEARQDEENDYHSVPQEQEIGQYIRDRGNGQVKSHEIALCAETKNEDIVHLAELVRVVDDDDEEIEISNLQASISCLQQATIQAKTIHFDSEEKKLIPSQPQSEKTFSSKASEEVAHQNTKQINTIGCDPQVIPFQLTPFSSEQNYEHNQKLTMTYANVLLENKQMGGFHSDTGLTQKQHGKAPHYFLECSTTDHAQEKNDGTLHAALDSLGRSSDFNASKGDFRAAMIYRNNSKSNMKCSSELSYPEVGSLSDTPAATSVTTCKQVSTEELNNPSTSPSSENQSPTTNKQFTSPSSEDQSQTLCVTDTQKSTRPSGVKPMIPPKPHHLQVHSGQLKESTKRETLNKTVQNTTKKENKTLRIEQQIVHPLSIKPMSYKDALCKGLSQKDNIAALSQQKDLDSEKPFSNVSTSEGTRVIGEIESNNQVEGSKVTFSKNLCYNDNILFQSYPSQPGVIEDVKYPQSCYKSNEISKDEVNVGWSEGFQKCERGVAPNRSPAKPKRVRIAQCGKNAQMQKSEENILGLHQSTGSEQVFTDQQCVAPNKCDGSFQINNKYKEEVGLENPVVMRKKKVGSETEDELRQRLSVHMDGIIRENVSTAMEIISHMREKEELQNILTTVEEIERDTSKVDVRSLKNVFEMASEWVVSPQMKKPMQIRAEHTTQMSLTGKNTESLNSMANVFGDLEKASEEIIHLKEQTLARLMDIEEAIKKALHSVSTLKSDADISGLSVLFKESLGSERCSPNASNIKTISIGSSRTKTPPAKEAPNTRSIRGMSEADQSPGEEIPVARNKSSPPSSPAFISIQSAARKIVKLPALPAVTTTVKQSSKTEDISKSAKTFSCKRTTRNKKKDSRNKGQKRDSHSLEPVNKSDVTILNVQSVPRESSTVRENYERTDSFGNRFYSSKTSTVVTAAPSGNVIVRCPATSEDTTHAEVRLPIRKPFPLS